MLFEIAASIFAVAAIALPGHQVQCCVKDTFEGTRLTALKNSSSSPIFLDGEITDYNFFSNAKRDNIVSIHHVTGCVTPVDELEEAVAIQIRGERIPIFYEGAIQNMPFLHSLHVESCQVNILKPKAFKHLPSLAVIKLQDNNIETISTNVFNNLMVKRLVLTSNNISYIAPEAFDDMPRLESINLDSNKLMNWNMDWFTNCPKVACLSVKFNELTSIPPRAFRNVEESLERLYLSGNNLQQISPRAFTGLRNLIDLGLYRNNITALDDTTFLYLGNLRMLDLSETSISCFSEPLLNTLRTDLLLWIDNIPLNLTCRVMLEEWAFDSDNTLTFFKTLKNVTD